MSPGERRRALLDWYDCSARSLPWRVGPHDRARGRTPDPYRVWLSEIMLQQTTIAHATPYFHRFLERWPRIADLAAAPLDEVLTMWAGLGYYARARNLHACAQAVAKAGGFPGDEAGLRALPGVGAYTAAAVAAIAYDQPATVVDGNVERVMARVFAVETPLPDSKAEVRRLAARLADEARPGDYAQALMDLGATVCTPRSPSCPACPWRSGCLAFASGAPEQFPRKRDKAERPRRRGVGFVLLDAGRIWLRRRPAKGLLGAMSEIPSTAWTPDPPDSACVSAAAPIDAVWIEAGAIEHVFTHFALDLRIVRAQTIDAAPSGEGWWARTDALDGEALPSVMRKAIARGLG